MEYIELELDIHKEFCIAMEMDKEGNIIKDGYRVKTNKR